MDAAYSSKMSVHFYQNTGCHLQDGSSLQRSNCKNLSCCKRSDVHYPKYNNSSSTLNMLGALPPSSLWGSLLKHWANFKVLSSPQFYHTVILVAKYWNYKKKHLVCKLLSIILSNLNTDSIQCQSLKCKCVAHITLAARWVFHKAWENKHNLAEIWWSTCHFIAPGTTLDFLEFC
jgi:hypothetical protein